MLSSAFRRFPVPILELELSARTSTAAICVQEVQSCYLCSRGTELLFVFKSYRAAICVQEVQSCYLCSRGTELEHSNSDMV